MPHDSEAVITRSLPHFDRTATAKRPEPGIRLVDSVQASRVPLPVATDENGQEIPFRKLERPNAQLPGSSQRGKSQTRTLSTRGSAGARREVPVQPRGRSDTVPPAGRNGLAGSSGRDDEALRRAPRSLGLKLEKGSDPAPERDGKNARPDDRGKPGPLDEKSDKVEKRRGHAVEKLFRGSRQRPAPRPLSEETRPDRPDTKPPAAQGRSTRGEETRDRGKRAEGQGETAGKRSSERDKERAGSSSGRGESGSKKSSGGKEDASNKRSERPPDSSKKPPKDKSSGGRGSEREKNRSRGR